MKKIIKIGTRNSKLAICQAKIVKNILDKKGHLTKLVEVSSKGDQILDTPLHKIGSTGLFTSALDKAMLKGTIDIAVHSLKDVPTDLPQGIVQAAVLERADAYDVLVYKGSREFLKDSSSFATVATGSLRRSAQWLHKYKNHKILDLRGNVNTRLKKLEDSNWSGAIFAIAGLQRINLLPENHIILDWMTPAPAQGAIMIAALEGDKKTLEVCEILNHKQTALCVYQERMFMKTLESGCTAPIGAYAKIKQGKFYFKGVLNSIEGQTQITINKSLPVNESIDIGVKCAKELLDNNGAKLVDQIKRDI